MIPVQQRPRGLGTVGLVNNRQARRRVGSDGSHILLHLTSKTELSSPTFSRDVTANNNTYLTRTVFRFETFKRHLKSTLVMDAYLWAGIINF